MQEHQLLDNKEQKVGPEKVGIQEVLQAL